MQGHHAGDRASGQHEQAAQKERKLERFADARGYRLGQEEQGEETMFHVATSTLTHLLATYGYLAVLLFVAIESTGIPFPGETMLLVAAIAAGTTHQLSIALVIVAAASGAILGDNLGFWVGREGGYRRLAPLRALHPPGGAAAQAGAVPVPQARRQGGLLRALRGGCCVPGPPFWPEPTACAGHASCSSMRPEASSGPRSTAWGATCSATISTG